MSDNIKRLADKLLGIIERDREDHLNKVERYLHGKHDDPYMPEGADREYKLLAKRSVSNLCGLVVATPTQALYVDGFRPGNEEADPEDPAALPPEWDHWQRSRLDARQNAIHSAAVAYGHSFAVTEKDDKGEVVTRGLSPLKTAAVYEDPANDIVPKAALWIKHPPTADEKGNPIPGRAVMWDDRYRYEVRYHVPSGGHSRNIVIESRKPTGLEECPVTRFAVSVDLEGRTMGVIEPIIPLQDRINQTVLDLLVAQTYGSFKVRTVTGMAPPVKLNGDGTPKIDPDTGRPIPLDVNLNARRFFFAEDSDVKFDSLPETPLGGYIDSISMSFQHFSAISQTPPHHLLGQIANLSAEALQAAEVSLQRRITSFQKAFGESWERVFNIAGRLMGLDSVADDVHGEVLWRDMESKSLSATADALVKLRNLNVPDEALWARIPGMTQGELKRLSEMRESDDYALQLLQLAQGIQPENKGVVGEARQIPDLPSAPKGNE